MLTPAKLIKTKKEKVPPTTKAYTKPDSFTEEINTQIPIRSTIMSS